MDEGATFNYDAHATERQTIKKVVSAVNALITDEYKITAEDLPAEFVLFVKKLIEKSAKNPPWWSRVDGYTTVEDGNGGYYKVPFIDPDHIPDHVWKDD